MSWSTRRGGTSTGRPLSSTGRLRPSLKSPGRTVPLVYVHAGLHHLEEPGAGLAEMARVAARAVSVTEPARAAVTALAVRLGLALAREEAGNRVARLLPAEVAAELRARGFRVVHADR